MARSLLLATLLAFVAGASVGAALLFDYSTLEGVAGGGGAGADGPEPRLARGGVAIDVTNEGTRTMEVALEVRDARRQLVFDSQFEVGAGGTVRRNMISLAAGAYTISVTTEGTVVQAETFNTDSCVGNVQAVFRVHYDGRAASPRGSEVFCR